MIKVLPRADDNVIKNYAIRCMSIKDTIDNANDDLAELYAEAKSNGVPIPEFKAAIAKHRLDADKRKKIEDREETIELILATLEGEP